MISTIEIINIFITSHSYFFCMCDKLTEDLAPKKNVKCIVDYYEMY